MDRRFQVPRRDRTWYRDCRKELRRRRSRPVRLIPDGENPALSVGMQKCGVAVINAGVQKTEEYIFACISAAVEILRLDNPGDFQ